MKFTNATVFNICSFYLFFYMNMTIFVFLNPFYSHFIKHVETYIGMQKLKLPLASKQRPNYFAWQQFIVKET